MTTNFLGSELPIVAAPLAGGPTTTTLAHAATEAGAFAFLAAGYKTPDAIAQEISVAGTWGRPFGVNLFVPGPDRVDTGAFARYAVSLATEAETYGITLDPNPRTDDDWWGEKLAMLLDDPVPVVSFTFALPSAGEIVALKKAGSTVLASVTTSDEALAAVDAGVDGLVVQGPAAGGHSATWDPYRTIMNEPTSQVVSAIRTRTTLPIVATGGVDGPRSLHELLAIGADAVAVGTLLLRTDESGASSTHKDALASPGFPETTITRAFTGRPARGLRNRFVDRHEAEAIVAYPAVHHLTRELRRRAAVAGDADRLHLWAGTGFRAAPTGSVADVIRWLAEGV